MVTMTVETTRMRLDVVSVFSGLSNGGACKLQEVAWNRYILYVLARRIGE